VKRRKITETEPVEEVQEFEVDDFIDKQETPKTFISTGCTLLDLAIAGKLPGGVASGRISHFYGDESTLKTAILAEIMGSIQRLGGVAFLDDVEGTWDNDFARLFGLDCSQKSFSKGHSKSVEDLFDNTIPKQIEKALKSDKPCLVGIDSLSALPSETELQSNIADASYGTSRAKSISQGFRKILRGLNESGLALVFIDQTRQNVGITFGDNKTVSGGNALKFYASTRVKLSHLKPLKTAKGIPYGVKIGFNVRKNKLSTPFKEGFFSFLFDYGIDDVGSSLEWLHETVGEKGKWEFKDLKSRGLNDLVKKIESENREEEVVAEVVEVWKELHKPIERKPKKR